MQKSWFQLSVLIFAVTMLQSTARGEQSPASAGEALPAIAGRLQDTDGTGRAASFFGPEGIATNGTHLFVADTNNNTIRKVSIASGSVTTLAGSATNWGSTDGAGEAARFSIPRGIATDGTNLYLADTNNNTIRKVVIATGVVTTLAGSAGMPGATDGTGGAARFNNPEGVATDGTNLYVADSLNHMIRKVAIATGMVTTLAGNPKRSGAADGTGALALFSIPRGVATDGTNLYVADSLNHAIRKVVIATGAVTTMAGSADEWGAANGAGPEAKFFSPHGITTDGTNLYVADTSNNTIRKVAIATGVVTTLAGSAGMQGATDGTGEAARFNNPEGIATDGTQLFVADTGSDMIRRVEIATGAVTTLAGSPRRIRYIPFRPAARP